MKKLVIACVLLAFTSCMKEGKPVVVKDSVSNYKVEKLFEIDLIWFVEQKMKYNERREVLHGKAY